jgi:putative hemolysin
VLSEQEVLDVIAAETAITADRRAMVAGVLELQTRAVREVLVPRRDVLALDDALTAAAAASQLAAANRSRAPVVRDGDLDDVVGTVALPRLVAASPATPVAELASAPMVLPDNAHIQDALQLLQRERVELAIVADEHGRTIGIVTVEDLLEELVGELYDEYDRDLSPTDPRGYQAQPDGSFLLPGTFPCHDLPDLGLRLTGEHEAATVGGLLLDALGRMPEVGDSADVGGVVVEARMVRGTVVQTVRVTTIR